MNLPRSVSDVVAEHVTFEVECIGSAARAVFEVMTTAITVFSRLVWYPSDCTTRTGRRLAGRLP